MSAARLLHDDALTVLKTLPAESVRCCVTSPPYWGLRDYGTARWEGGEDGCDHVEARGTTRGGPRSTITGGQDTTPHLSQFRGVCRKCGAIRKDRQLGLERTPEEYVARLVEVFREVRRVLTNDGTLWLNLGDSYCADRGNTASKPGYDNKAAQGHATLAIRDFKIAGQNGLKPKDIVGIPWSVAFALRADGWWLRSDIIWSKPNPMPESVTDRPTRAHEYVFLLSKAARYYYNADAIAEEASYGSHGGDSTNPGAKQEALGHNLSGSLGLTPRQRESRKRGEFQGKTNVMPGREAFRAIVETRNARSVWEIATQPYPEAHFATFPEELAQRCILAGSAPGDVVLDPFCGSGTTCAVAVGHGRDAIGIDVNPTYLELARQRIGPLLCAGVAS